MDMSLDWKKRSLSRRIDILTETSGLSPERVRNGHELTSFSHFRSLYGYDTLPTVQRGIRSGNRNKEQRILQRLEDWLQQFYIRENMKSRMDKVASEVPNILPESHRKNYDTKSSKHIFRQGFANIHIGKPRFRRKSSSTSSSPTGALDMSHDEEMTKHVVENYDTGAIHDDQNVLDMIQSAKARSQNLSKASPMGGAAERKLRQRNKKNTGRRVADSDSLSVCSGNSIDSESFKKAEELAFTANKYGTLPRMKFNLGFLKSAFEDKSDGSAAAESTASVNGSSSTSKATGTARRRSFLKFNKKEKRDSAVNREGTYYSSQSTSLPSTPNASSLFWTAKPIYLDGPNTAPVKSRGAAESSTLPEGVRSTRFRSSNRRKLFSMPIFYTHKKESREMDNI